MCGIAGIFDTQGAREIDQALLARMNQAQHHRSPDETGLHAEPGVGLAHKRLPIIDLSSGHQPLFNEDGSVVVVFNGEIYNPFGDQAALTTALEHALARDWDRAATIRYAEENGWAQRVQVLTNEFQRLLAVRY